MPESALRHEFVDFATELRKLAYTMPAGHEDRLIHLSERMIQCALRAAGQRSVGTA